MEKSLPLQCVNMKDILFMKKLHECTKTQYSTRYGGTQQWSPLEPKAWWPSDGAECLHALSTSGDHI